MTAQIQSPDPIRSSTPPAAEPSLWPWALTLVWMSMAAGVGIIFLGAYIATGMDRIREREMAAAAAVLYGVASVPMVGLMLVGRRLFLKLHWVLQWIFMAMVFFLNIAVIVAAVLFSMR